MKRFIKIIVLCGLFLPQLAEGQQVNECIIKVGRHKKEGFVATTDKYGKATLNNALTAKLEKGRIEKTW